MDEEWKGKFPKNLRDVDDDSPEVKEAIEALRRMIQEEEGLHLRTDDRYILKHLYTTHFDVKKAFNKIQEYFTLKMQYPQWFPEKPIKEYQSLLDLHTHYILPERDRKGRRVFLIKMGNIDTSVMKASDMSVLDEIGYEAVVYEPETLKNGTLTITDMSGYSYRHMTWLRPDNLNIAARKCECTAQLEHHEHHIVNSSMLINAAFSLMSPFINKNTKDHVFFHYNDYEALHKHVNPEILPEEYGGTGPALDYDAVYERFLYNQEDIFQQFFQEGYKK